MDTSGCGPTLAVSTSEAAQSYPRPSIPCIGGMKKQKYARAGLARGSTQHIPRHESRHPNLAAPPSPSRLSHTLRSLAAVPSWFMKTPVTINLALWESNYYRCTMPHIGPKSKLDGPLQLRQVHLKYQDLPHRNITFEIDDSVLTENGFTCCDAYPKKFTGNTLTLTSTNPLCTKVYSDRLTNHRFVVGLGQSFRKAWIRVVSDESNIDPQPPGQDYIMHNYFKMLDSASEHAQHMNKARSRAEQIRIMHTRLPRTTRILRISSVTWKSSRMCGVKLDVFHDPGFGGISGEWTAFDVKVGSFFACHTGTDITIYLGNRRSRL